MSWYAQVVFPRVCEFLLDRPLIAEQRCALLADASGEVLEIGFGTGLNLPCYPPGVRQLTTVDPSPGMHRLAQRRIRRAGRPIDHRVLEGERLPFAAHSFDAVVSTFTLCTIDGVERALAEAFRVLRPGGKFLFLEHGLSPRPKVQRWQRRLNWLEMKLAGGCRLDRPITSLVRAQPFASIEAVELDMPGMPPTHGHLFRGAAIK